MKTHAPRGCPLAAMLIYLAAFDIEAAERAGASENEMAPSLHLSGEATATDTGLPMYPGSQSYVDDEDSKSAANIGVSAGAFGVKVVVVKLQTADSVEKVTLFYRQALAKYGVVLECRDGADRMKSAAASTSETDELACEPDDPGSFDVVFKAGKKLDQRIVAIRSHGRGTQFNLAHVNIRGPHKD